MNRSSRGAFSPVTMIVVLLVGVVALAGLGVLSAYTPELKSGNDGGDGAERRRIGGGERRQVGALRDGVCSAV